MVVQGSIAPGVGSGGVAGGANGVVNGRGDGPGAAKKEWTRKRETTDDGKGQASSKGICRYFQSEDGCWRGASCHFVHDLEGKKGRRWNCGSSKHMKKDCKVQSVEKDGGPLKLDGKPEAPSATKSKSADGPVVEEKPAEGAKDCGKPEGKGEVGGILSEAMGLLKTLQLPAIKALQLEEKDDDVKISSFEVKEKKGEDVKASTCEGKGEDVKASTCKMKGEDVKISALGVRDRRALLDGGATHCLRQAADEAEWKSGIEVEVALASGTAMLRQIPWTKTLVTQQPVQPIVPLGVLAELGYAIKWESRSFELQDSKGRILDTDLENSCPTVSENLGLQLIKEIEAGDAAKGQVGCASGR